LMVVDRRGRRPTINDVRTDPGPPAEGWPVVQECYKPEAYAFVLDSLNRVMAAFSVRRHVSGEELLAGIREHARERFGPLAKDVLNSWGVTTTLDFGRIVFHMVEARLLSATPEDSLSDFVDKFDFTEAFEDNYFENRAR
jgi:uncharacterized repeat protein (TIGR04138 family)